jgi:hypothetical protein
MFFSELLLSDKFCQLFPKQFRQSAFCVQMSAHCSEWETEFSTRYNTATTRTSSIPNISATGRLVKDAYCFEEWFYAMLVRYHQLCSDWITSCLLYARLT